MESIHWKSIVWWVHSLQHPEKKNEIKELNWLSCIVCSDAVAAARLQTESFYIFLVINIFTTSQFLFDMRDGCFYVLWCVLFAGVIRNFTIIRSRLETDSMKVWCWEKVVKLCLSRMWKNVSITQIFFFLCVSKLFV